MAGEIVILCAIKKEAGELLFHSKYKFKKEKNCYVYKSDNLSVKVYITGIGRKKVLDFAKNNNFDNVDLIIKAGTCAVLGNDTELLKPVIPSFAVYNEDTLKLNFENLPDKIKNKINDYAIYRGLATVDKPLTDKKTGEEFLKENIRLIDMETFHLLNNYKNIPFLPLLIGTDRADKYTLLDFLRNLNKASKILREEIADILDKIKKHG
ncbi:MAG: hypothetical protein JXB50_08230 [Spirochaetes bacterium]|nr:hypothetical protein [Spirochaetota bacterium]